MEATFSNEDAFPQDFESPLPPKFEDTARNMFKRIFRVYAHIKCHHDEVIKAHSEKGGVKLSAMVDLLFDHFAHFVLYFELVEPREMDPLKKDVEVV